MFIYYFGYELFSVMHSKDGVITIYFWTFLWNYRINPESNFFSYFQTIESNFFPYLQTINLVTYRVKIVFGSFFSTTIVRIADCETTFRNNSFLISENCFSLLTLEAIWWCFYYYTVFALVFVKPSFLPKFCVKGPWVIMGATMYSTLPSP